MDNNDNYVSNISTSLLTALFEMVQLLKSKPASPPNEVQANPTENGLSCSVIVIAVLVLESVFNRVKMITGSTTRDPKTLFLAVARDAKLAENVDELFSIRDVIVHNHMWSAKVGWDESANLGFASEPSLMDGYGNPRYRKVINLKSRRSNLLDLNMFPTKIWRRDAFIVVREVWNILKCLEQENINFVSFSSLDFEYEGNFIYFQTLIGTFSIPKH